ncbi:MAG: transposase [Beijerinckiaceae bacterium]|nr:transposase [Beijerinckiaceae bacterium]
MEGLSRPLRRQGLAKDHDADGHAFIRRFLLHVLPDGFHRIRHYGLLASSRHAYPIARIREIIAAPTPDDIARDDVPVAAAQPEQASELHPPCPCCGGRMILVERFAPGTAPRTIVAVRIDTS